MNEDVALLAVFRSLSESDQASVLSYAEFLASKPVAKQGSSSVLSASTEIQVVDDIEPIPEPNLIPRPEQETVIKAIKRLSTSYFMLSKKNMLGATSEMMMKHIVHGDDAGQVIDELEAVFQDAYRQLQDKGE